MTRASGRPMHKSATRFVHLSGLEITTGLNIRQDFPRHIHDSWCIGWIECGARLITTQDTETLISSGEVFVLNPRQAHACQTVGTGASYHIISLGSEVMRAFGMPPHAAAPHPVFQSIRIVDQPLTDAIRALCQRTERTIDPFECQTHLVQVLTRLMAHSNCPPDERLPASQRDVICQACEYIQACHARKISLAELADVCHLSAYHLQRTFVELTGLSPHDYLVHVRIKQSKTLLRQGLPLADIARTVGFVDQSHFTHTFKCMVGMTPGYFARQCHATANARR